MLQTEERIQTLQQTSTIPKTPFAIQELLGLTNSGEPEMGMKGGSGAQEVVPPFSGYTPRSSGMLHPSSMADQFSLSQACHAFLSVKCYKKMSENSLIIN